MAKRAKRGRLASAGEMLAEAMLKAKTPADRRRVQQVLYDSALRKGADFWRQTKRRVNALGCTDLDDRYDAMIAAARKFERKATH